MLCNRNICEKLEFNFAVATEEIINSNEEFIRYIRELKYKVNQLVRKQIKKNMSLSRSMNNSNLDDLSESNSTTSRTKITLFKKKDNKISWLKTSPKKSPERSITPKSSRFKIHKSLQRSVDIQDLSDSGLGTSRFEPDDTKLTLDHSTPFSSLEISQPDLTEDIIKQERISETQHQKPSPLDISRECPLFSKKRDTVDKFADKTSSVVTPIDPIFEIRSTWAQRSVAMANHVRSRFYERIHAFVGALIVGVLIWIALVLGAILGATLCNYGRLSIPPVSSFHAKPHMVFY